MATIHVTVSKIDEALFDGQAASVRVPGSEGEMTILPHHEALISQLREGTVVVSVDGEEKQFPVVGGMLEVSNNRATILV